jgi:predicted lactoylglutathione lyase
MSTTVQAPRLTNAATKPARPHKLFVNIPVADLQRSITFFEALGFSFNAQFTDATATCMLVGEDAYFMLLTREKFARFARREIGEPWDQTAATYAISVDSRAEVDAMVTAAIAAGGVNAAEPQDHGFMYGWSFYDPDGHHWEVFWMND